jgi:queuine tRNA-ribosyltransferase accessory subunit
MTSDISLLPEEMLKFVLESSHHLPQSPRLGRLLSHGRPPIHTPHYVAATSRGVIPHLSHDVLQKHTDINSAYIGLEDCTFDFLIAAHRHADPPFCS